MLIKPFIYVIGELTMCGIIATSGSEDMVSMAVEGLKKLEYRGYDSFGFAVRTPGKLAITKSLEPMSDFLESLPAGQSVIGHTRWATHGGVTLDNCHPHLSQDETFALAHNGIVENCQSLMQFQMNNLTDKSVIDGKGISDSRIIVALLAEALSEMDRAGALIETVSMLEGRNAIVVIFEDGEIFGVRKGSPLMIGRNEHCVFLGSDVLSFGDWATQCCALEDYQLVKLVGPVIERFDFSGARVSLSWDELDYQRSFEDMDAYPHYMLKEIMEQWRTIPAQKVAFGDRFEDLLQRIKCARRVFLTGAGGAYFAARQISWLLSNVAAIDVFDVPAYEVESYLNLMGDGDIILAVSQSGETADTIDAVQMAKAKGLYAACLVNMPYSTLTRMCDMTFYNRCGPERCVLSTKSASSQITFGYLLAGSLRDDLPCLTGRIDSMTHQLSLYLDQSILLVYERLAKEIFRKKHLFVLGRKEFYATAMIAALNIKEASYLHAEAFAAGELKHGVIALVEKGTPVIVYAGKEDNYMLNVSAELKSRGAFIIGIAAENNPLFHRHLPLPGAHLSELVAVSSIIPGQLLAYYLSVIRGHNPDKPRNLAKSVTVR